MYNSQIGQDELCDRFLDFKVDGYFLDIGAHHYKHISNTFFFEKVRNWKGIAIDIDNTFEEEWISNRSNSYFICQDATQINYNKLIQDYNFPTTIDFLSIDLDPPQTTLDALYKVFSSDLKFNVITFEVDDYRQRITKDLSREFLKSKGYHFVAELYDRNSTGMIHVDDFWINPNILKNTLN